MRHQYIKGKIKIEGFVADVISVDIQRELGISTTRCNITTVNGSDDLRQYMHRTIPKILLKSPTFKMRFIDAVISEYAHELNALQEPYPLLVFSLEAKSIEVLEQT